MADYRKLRVWQHAHALMLDVHRLVKGIRGSQYLSLRSQIMRAAMSIPANIVEGRAQKSERDFARFLGYALASTLELEYELLVARDIGVLGVADHARLSAQVEDVRKMLHGLIATLNRQSAPPVPV
jgi:four helix bundle protein